MKKILFCSFVCLFLLSTFNCDPSTGVVQHKWICGRYHDPKIILLKDVKALDRIDLIVTCQPDGGIDGHTLFESHDWIYLGTVTVK